MTYSPTNGAVVTSGWQSQCVTVQCLEWLLY